MSFEGIEFIECKLDDIAEVHNSKRIPLNSRDREKRKGTFPYYGASGIVDYVDGYLFDGEYVLISEDGENLRSRNTPIAFKTDGKFWVNNHAHILKGKEPLLNDYIVYYFANLDLNPYVTGAVQPKLNKENLLSIPITLPKDKKQRNKIVSILKSFDEKIELNRQTNQTLEAIAQAIFKDWFVNFNFPGANGESIDGLPKDWKKITISEIASNIQYGFTQSSSIEEVGPKFLRITDIQGGEVHWQNVPYCKTTEKDLPKYKIQEHDIFIARTGASTGENIYIIDSPNAVFASYLIRVQFDKPCLACYIGKFLRSSIYFDYVGSILSGSAQPNANAQQLTGIEIVLPTDDILEQFYKVINPINHKKSSIEKENQFLADLRDSLLPKLMKGEISVMTTEEEYLVT